MCSRARAHTHTHTHTHIYIYIYQTHINNQTQIAKEEEENEEIVKEQGVKEEVAAAIAVNGEPQNHHPCSGKTCPKSLPKLQTQNHWP